MTLAQHRHLTDEGSISPYLIVAGLSLFLIAGFAVDVSGAITASAHASDIAAAAARTGGEQVDVGTAIKGDEVQVDRTEAVVAARTYLAGSGATGTVAVSGNTLTVNVTDTYDTVFLSAIGFSAITVHGDSSAELVRAIDGIEE